MKRYPAISAASNGWNFELGLVRYYLQGPSYHFTEECDRCGAWRVYVYRQYSGRMNLPSVVCRKCADLLLLEYALRA